MGFHVIWGHRVILGTKWILLRLQYMWTLPCFPRCGYGTARQVQKWHKEKPTLPELKPRERQGRTDASCPFASQIFMMKEPWAGECNCEQISVSALMGTGIERLSGFPEEGQVHTMNKGSLPQSLLSGNQGFMGLD